ncbi:MAG TPA: hypothetical protein VEC39_18590 [Vicinamibacterales bacterium]|nr:hypothetical protein [Vicinamibacterales bacterium]
MLFNDLFALLMEVPPLLAVQWGVWFVVGLALSVWQRREKARLIIHGPAPRHTSGVRPPSAVRAAVKKPVTPARTTGDPFGELEQLLDEPTTRSHRTPGEHLPAPQALP